MAVSEFKPRYFASAQEAVTVITQLLVSESWRELAEYYALDAQDPLRPALIDGSFFVNREEPAVRHPGGFWRIREPFSPGFHYAYHHSLAENFLQVRVRIELQQGADSPPQVGLGDFYLKRSSQGLQIVANRDRPEPDLSLPEIVEAPKPMEEPPWASGDGAGADRSDRQDDG